MFFNYNYQQIYKGFPIWQCVYEKNILNIDVVFKTCISVYNLPVSGNESMFYLKFANT